MDEFVSRALAMLKDPDEDTRTSAGQEVAPRAGGWRPAAWVGPGTAARARDVRRGAARRAAMPCP